MASAPSNVVQIIDFRRDEAAFRALWALDQDLVPTAKDGDQLLEDLGDARKAVILLEIDGVSGFNLDKFGPHVSALDWVNAVCFALTQRGKQLPLFAVVDLRDPMSGRVDESGSQRRASHVSFFRRTSADLERFTTYLDGFDRFRSATPSVLSLEGKAALELDLSQWLLGVGHANNRDDHHAINNSVGPLALAAQCPDGVRSEVLAARQKFDQRSKRENHGAAAMMRIFDWFGVGRNSSGSVEVVSKNALPIEPLVWAEVFREANFALDQELRILLLDDQAQMGWLPIFIYLFALKKHAFEEADLAKSFVKCAVSPSSAGTPPVSLFVCTSRDSFEKSLLNNCNLRENSAAFPNRLNLTDCTVQPAVEILLLDLRLVPDVPQGAAKLDSLSVLRGILRGRSEEQATIKRIEESEELDVLDRLTIPAEVLSRCDYSYPIIIWSSTSQRSIIEKLKRFRNVYTELQKPRFDTYFVWDGLPALKVQIQSAFRHQLGLVKSRKFIEDVIQKTSDAANLDPAFKNLQLQISKYKYHHVAIFVDESGTDDLSDERHKAFKQGGIAVISSADERTAASEAFTQFQSLMESSAVRVFIDPRAPDCTKSVQFNFSARAPKGGDVLERPDVEYLTKWDTEFVRLDDSDRELKLAKNSLAKKNIKGICNHLEKKLHEFNNADESRSIGSIAFAWEPALASNFWLEDSQLDRRHIHGLGQLLGALVSIISGASATTLADPQKCPKHYDYNFFIATRRKHMQFASMDDLIAWNKRWDDSAKPTASRVGSTSVNDRQLAPSGDQTTGDVKAAVVPGAVASLTAEGYEYVCKLLYPARTFFNAAEAKLLMDAIAHLQPTLIILEPTAGATQADAMSGKSELKTNASQADAMSGNLKVSYQSVTNSLVHGLVSQVFERYAVASYDSITAARAVRINETEISIFSGLADFIPRHLLNSPPRKPRPLVVDKELFSGTEESRVCVIGDFGKDEAIVDALDAVAGLRYPAEQAEDAQVSITSASLLSAYRSYSKRKEGVSPTSFVGLIFAKLGDLANTKLQETEFFGLADSLASEKERSSTTARHQG